MICFLNFVSIIIISEVTGTFVVQSQCFFVPLNLDFDCDLPNVTKLVLIKISEKFKKWRDPQIVYEVE